MSIEKEVKVVISAVDEYSGGMGKFNYMAAAVVTSVVAIGAALVAASVEAAKFGWSLGGDLFTSASEFHDAMYDVVAVAASFGTSAEDIEGMLDRLTVQFPITGKQAGEALQQIAQLGMGGKEELEKMAVAANTLQIATGTDLPIVIKGMTTIMNAFGLEIDEADRIMNLLAATSFNSGASVADLADALKYAASASAMSGISIEETAAMLGILRDNGLEASQAGTVFRTSLVMLSKETTKGKEVLKEYGLTYDDVNPSVFSLSEIIGKFEGKTMDARQAARLFGTEALSMGLVVNKGKEAFDSMVTTVTNTTAAVDAMNEKQKQWKVIQDQVGGSVDALKNKIAGGLVPEVLEMIGKNEHEGFRGVLTYLTELEKQYGNLNEALMNGFGGAKDALKDVWLSSFGTVEELYNYISLLSAGLGENFKMVATWVGVWANWGLEVATSLRLMKFILHAMNTAFTGFSLVISVIHDAFALALNAWILGINGVQLGWANLKLVATHAMLAIVKAMDYLPFVDMSSKIESLEAKVKQYGVEAENAFDPKFVNMWTDDVGRAYYKTAESIVALHVPTAKIQETTEEATESARDFLAEINAMDGSGLHGVFDQTQKVADTVEKAATDLVLVNGEWREMARSVAVVKEEAVNLNKAVSEMSDREFTLFTERFKADLALIAQESQQTHDMVMASIEWKAKLDIADVEANAERVKAAFDSVAISVQATADATSSMLGDFATFEGNMTDKWYMQRIIDQQMKLQQEALGIQRDLADAEIAFTNAKTERIKSLSDEAMITVNGDGLKPHLEMIMWEIFEQIQIRATQEGLDKLLLGA